MTVLERIKELGEKRAAAHRAYKAKPSKALHDAWLEATANLDLAVEGALDHLIAVAEAEIQMKEADRVMLDPKSGHGDRSGACDDEKDARRKIDAALAELTKGAGDER